MDLFQNIFDMTGFGSLLTNPGYIIMILIGCILLFLGISKKYEPLLLVPIGFGIIIANIPNSNLGVVPVDPSYSLIQIANEHGIINLLYYSLIKTGFLPPLIFMGIGALTDFGPMLKNLRLVFFGAAAQIGIFSVLIIASFLGFDNNEAAALAIIGGADGPTAIYVSSILAPELLGAIAVAAYSYMALVPLIQPPIMRLLTTNSERTIRMVQLREVSQKEKIVFPIILVFLVGMMLPSAAPLIGMFCLGNLMRESLVVERLSEVVQNSLINIVTIFLGLAVGSKLAADQFLTPETLGILSLGIIAFSIGTASGILMAKLMNALSKNKINPLIGAAGVSAVPMAARVVNKVGLENDSQNFLLMHAMGPNVAGVIGSAVAAGVMIQLLA